MHDHRFRQKFRSFVEQYELRELHYHALIRTKEGEVQLNLARYEDQRRRADAETTKARTLSHQVTTFTSTETELRSQLNIYVEKFKQASSPPPQLLHESNSLSVSLHQLLSEYYSKNEVFAVRVSTFSKTVDELRRDLLDPIETCKYLSSLLMLLAKQVEDTLNNSNDLFLTFRKEMEEMSKKTKRLEKENLALTRKHDLTNRNIIEMAEERTKVNKDMEQLRKRNTTLESLVRRMQDQGRAPAGAGAIENDETESEYDDGDYDEEEGSEDEEYDDDTEEESLQAQVGALPTSQAQVNGKVNGEVNGVKPMII